MGWRSQEQVAGLRARLKEMEAEREGLEARRERLELPAIDREMLGSLVDNFENVMAEGPNPKKKHLLHLLVKKVLIHSRKTVEIWYVLPNSQRFANCNIWLPKCPTLLTARWTPRYGSESSTSPRLAPKALGDPKSPREPKVLRVVELLRKANEWKALLKSGKVASQAEIALREGITRARVTQIMGILRLAPEIQKRILSMPDGVGRASLTERMLRPFGTIADQRDQLREFHRILL